MVERIMLSKRYFIYIGILTVIIFFIGFIVGYNLDLMKSEFIEKETANAVLESESFTISEMYLQNNTEYCRLMETRIPQIGKIVDQLGQDLDNFAQKNVFVNYTSLNRRYFLYEIRFWMSVEEYKQKCNKNITTVVFFYKLRHSASYDQGIVLTALKDIFKDNIYIFSFDTDFTHEPMIDILKQEYEVKEVPALIINKKMYQGPLSKEQMLSIINKGA
jgi:hypothetical protein